MHCTACGYDLTAHDSGARCPECGLEVAITVEVLRERQLPWSHEKLAGYVAWHIALLAAGALSCFLIFSAAWASTTPWGFSLFVLIFGVGPAFAAGLIGGHLWKTQLVLWSTVFAWPMLLVSFTCLLSVPAEATGILVWPGMGLAMAGAGVAGGWAGRRSNFRRLLEAMRKTPTDSHECSTKM